MKRIKIFGEPHRSAHFTRLLSSRKCSISFSHQHVFYHLSQFSVFKVTKACCNTTMIQESPLCFVITRGSDQPMLDATSLPRQSTMAMIRFIHPMLLMLLMMSPVVADSEHFLPNKASSTLGTLSTHPCSCASSPTHGKIPGMAFYRARVADDAMDHQDRIHPSEKYGHWKTSLHDGANGYERKPKTETKIREFVPRRRRTNLPSYKSTNQYCSYENDQLLHEGESVHKFSSHSLILLYHFSKQLLP